MSLRSLLRGIPLFHYFFNCWKGTAISFHKTLFFNLGAFPLKTALKFPIWIYQGVKIEQIGNIAIQGDISSGQIRIGQRMFFRNIKTTFINRGTITFNGNCIIMGGCTIHVLRDCSQLNFGENVMVGEKVSVLCDTNISLGDFSRISFGTLFIDSEFHYVLNTKTGDIMSRTKPIVIGKYNWIGNSSVIKKGSVTPDYCIVSNGSMVTKDFSSEEHYTLLLGVPAKVKGTGFRRVYNDDNDIWLNDQFKAKGLDKVNIPMRNNDINYDNFCNGYINVLKH